MEGTGFEAKVGKLQRSERQRMWRSRRRHVTLIVNNFKTKWQPMRTISFWDDFEAILDILESEQGLEETLCV